jgi:hypothetical protein
MTAHQICQVEELREVYGFPPDNSAALRIVRTSLHEYHRDFIALSPSWLSPPSTPREQRMCPPRETCPVL